MIRRFVRALSRQDWTTVLIELAVVVVGILIALQVSQWAESREQRGTEQTYLLRLKEDLQIERKRVGQSEGFAKERLAAVAMLDRVATNPATAESNSDLVPWVIETASWRSFPKINAFVYNELQSTGRMSLIRSVALRRALAEHYATIEHDARVGEDRKAEEAFDVATAGLLSMEQLTHIERVAGNPRRVKMDKGQALVLAEAFAARRDARDQLPGLAQHHLFNLRVIGDMRTRIDGLIVMVDDELRGSRPASR